MFTKTTKLQAIVTSEVNEEDPTTTDDKKGRVLTLPFGQNRANVQNQEETVGKKMKLKSNRRDENVDPEEGPSKKEKLDPEKSRRKRKAAASDDDDSGAETTASKESTPFAYLELPSTEREELGALTRARLENQRNGKEEERDRNGSPGLPESNSEPKLLAESNSEVTSTTSEVDTANGQDCLPSVVAPADGFLKREPSRMVTRSRKRLKADKDKDKGKDKEKEKEKEKDKDKEKDKEKEKEKSVELRPRKDAKETKGEDGEVLDHLVYGIYPKANIWPGVVEWQDGTESVPSVEGNKITFTSHGVKYTGEFFENRIIFSDGEEWVKEMASTTKRNAQASAAEPKPKERPPVSSTEAPKPKEAEEIFLHKRHDNLNETSLRQRPDSNSLKTATVNGMEELKLLERSDDWARVEAPGGSGWLEAGNLLSMELVPGYGKYRNCCKSQEGKKKWATSQYRFRKALELEDSRSEVEKQRNQVEQQAQELINDRLEVTKQREDLRKDQALLSAKEEELANVEQAKASSKQEPANTAELERMRQVLEKKDSVITKQENELQQRMREMEQKRRDLEEQENAIKQQENAIKQKEKHLEEVEATAAAEPPAETVEEAPEKVKITKENMWKVQIEAIYSRRNPHKLKDVDTMLQKEEYKNNHKILFLKICKRYDLDPTKLYTDPKSWGEDKDMLDDDDDRAGKAPQVANTEIVVPEIQEKIVEVPKIEIVERIVEVPVSQKKNHDEGVCWSKGNKCWKASAYTGPKGGRFQICERFKDKEEAIAWRREMVEAGKVMATKKAKPDDMKAKKLAGTFELTGNSCCSGIYMKFATNHKRPVYQRVDEYAKPTSQPMFVYYWDDRDRPEFRGWWISREVGAEKVYGHNRGFEHHPPKSGWHMPFRSVSGPVNRDVEVSWSHSVSVKKKLLDEQDKAKREKDELRNDLDESHREKEKLRDELEKLKDVENVNNFIDNRSYSSSFLVKMRCHPDVYAKTIPTDLLFPNRRLPILAN